MSAYGAIARPIQDDSPLPSTLWRPKPMLNNAIQTRPYISIHHLNLSATKQEPGLVEYLSAVFAKEVEDGLTYPQEGDMNQSTFEAYFFAADVFVAILLDSGGVPGQSEESGALINGTSEPITTTVGVETARAGRPWEDCLVGFYYVKPNYPGRSSHICNAGFVVPPKHRGGGYGTVLAKSYVHYAPKLGYKASVFNLVYVNNVASIRLWEQLRFIKAGRIPNAGRLRRKDGQGEEFVDAWIFYKSFEENSD